MEDSNVVRDVKTMRCCQSAFASPTVLQSGIRFPLSSQRAVFGSQTGRPIGASIKRPSHTKSQVLASQKVHSYIFDHREFGLVGCL